MQVSSAMPTDVTFVYPESQRYPFDSVCEKIVRALQERNWQVPTIEVKFRDYCIGELAYREVKEVGGTDFKLYFGREGAEISKLVIPRQELQVYADESGPTYYTYVGNDWKNDQDDFMNCCKSSVKACQRYSGSMNINAQQMYRDVVGKRNCYLVKDVDRQVEIGNRVAHCFYTNQVFLEFDRWLSDNVLKQIESFSLLKFNPKCVEVPAVDNW